MKSMCVLAVHNEEQYLRYTLGAVKNVGCGVVVVLDRCSDGSERMIRQILPTATLVFKDGSTWRYPISEAKNVGVEVARNLGADAVLMLDADVLLDAEKIKRSLPLLGDAEVLVLTLKRYSLFGSCFDRVVDEISNLFAVLTRKLKIHPVRYGIYVVKTKGLKIPDCHSQYDVMQQRMATVWVETETLHLRPRNNVEAQVEAGWRRAQLPQYSLLRVFLYSLFTLHPLTLAGYLKCKLR